MPDTSCQLASSICVVRRWSSLFSISNYHPFSYCLAGIIPRIRKGLSVLPFPSSPMSSPSSQSTTKPSNQDNHNNSNNLQLCRVISEAKYTARSNRYNRTKPQPWLVRKLMVFVTLGIIGYTGYVYIGRFCVGILSNGQHGDGMGRRIGRGAGSEHS